MDGVHMNRYWRTREKLGKRGIFKNLRVNSGSLRELGNICSVGKIGSLMLWDRNGGGEKLL